MKTGQNSKRRTLFNIVELGNNMKVYAPIAKRDPKGDGIGYVDTGYELTNERQVRTNRAVTCKLSGNELSYRASDSYPMLVDMGSIYLNPAGTK